MQPQLRFSVNGFDPTPQEAGRVSGCLQLSLLPLSGYIMTLSLWKLCGRLCLVLHKSSKPQCTLKSASNYRSQTASSTILLGPGLTAPEQPFTGVHSLALIKVGSGWIATSKTSLIMPPQFFTTYTRSNYTLCLDICFDHSNVRSYIRWGRRFVGIYGKRKIQL